MDPEKTTHLGKPVGKDSGTATWEGDQWKIGGGTTWGWYSVDPELNLIYYGTGNPGTWNPVQRPGDNRWSMTIFARDADTGMAKWVYQMTPHDEWDYDGVNEMILADIPVKGEMTQGSGPLRPQRLRLHAGPRDRRAAGRREVRSGGQLGDPCRHGDRPAAGGVALLDRRTTARTSTPPTSARRRSAPRTSSRRRTQPEDRPVLRADQPRLHGLRAVQGVATPPASPMSAPRSHVPGAGRHRPRQLHRLGRRARARSCGRNPEPFSVWSGALATAGDVVFYGTLEGYLKAVDADTGRELYRFKTPSGHHRQRQHLDAQGQAVCRRAVGRRRLGRHRPRGRPDAAGERPGLARRGPAAAARATRPSTPPASVPSVPTSRSATTPSSAVS